jgi:hypothetical protein
MRPSPACIGRAGTGPDEAPWDAPALAA